MELNYMGIPLTAELSGC